MRSNGKGSAVKGAEAVAADGGRRILFIENSIGVSGSTISLCTLLAHLSPRSGAPCLVFSREDQRDYVLGRVQRHGGCAVIAQRESLRNASVVRRICRRLEGRCRWVLRPLQFLVAALDVAVVTLPYALRICRFARGRRIGLIHQNNGFDVGALLAARLLRVPMLAYQRGDEWDSFLVRALAPRVDAYIANSQATKDNLVSLGVPPDKIRVVYPPVDLGRFALEKPASLRRRDFGVDARAPSFGIVGMLLAWKGQRVFLEAAQRVFEVLPEARGWIVGGVPQGGEAYEDELHNLARTLGIAGKIIFTGFQPEVPEVIRLLDVVVHASTSPEPFGRVIVEAMAMKKPVVAMDAGGPREIITHGRTGLLVPPGKPEELAEAILCLLRDRSLAERIAEEGYRDATRRFWVEAHVERVQRIYDDVLGRAQGTEWEMSAGSDVPTAGTTQGGVR